MKNIIILSFLFIILSVRVSETLTPSEHYAQSSILFDQKIYFFGGIDNAQQISNKILYVDVSKPFNTTNPPFEELPGSIPFKSCFATVLPDFQKNLIYLFGGIMRDKNDRDNFRSILQSYDLKSNIWSTTNTDDEPKRRREINGVINNDTGKFYVFGGIADQLIGAQSLIFFNDLIIYDTNSPAWSSGSLINAPLPRSGYTATLLNNGYIIFIGGRDINLRDVSLEEVAIYDTTTNGWSLMATKGDALEGRNKHSAVLTPDERIIIFGGEKGNGGGIVTQPLAVLDTKTLPYEWSIPPDSSITPLPNLIYHSATLVGNYMFVNFGNNSYPSINPNIKIPFFYILDIRNFTWVTQFEPQIFTPPPSVPTTSPTNSPTNSSESSDNGKNKSIIIGSISVAVVISVCAIGLLGYNFYKKRQYYNKNVIPTG